MITLKKHNIINNQLFELSNHETFNSLLRLHQDGHDLTLPCLKSDETTLSYLPILLNDRLSIEQFTDLYEKNILQNPTKFIYNSTENTIKLPSNFSSNWYTTKNISDYSALFISNFKDLCNQLNKEPKIPSFTKNASLSFLNFISFLKNPIFLDISLSYYPNSKDYLNSLLSLLNNKFFIGSIFNNYHSKEYYITQYVLYKHILKDYNQQQLEYIKDFSKKYVLIGAIFANDIDFINKYKEKLNLSTISYSEKDSFFYYCQSEDMVKTLLKSNIYLYSKEESIFQKDTEYNPLIFKYILQNSSELNHYFHDPINKKNIIYYLSNKKDLFLSAVNDFNLSLKDVETIDILYDIYKDNLEEIKNFDFDKRYCSEFIERIVNLRLDGISILKKLKKLKIFDYQDPDPLSILCLKIPTKSFIDLLDSCPRTHFNSITKNNEPVWWNFIYSTPPNHIWDKIDSFYQTDTLNNSFVKKMSSIHYKHNFWNIFTKDKKSPLHNFLMEHSKKPSDISTINNIFNSILINNSSTALISLLEQSYSQKDLIQVFLNSDCFIESSTATLKNLILEHKQWRGEENLLNLITNFKKILTSDYFLEYQKINSLNISCNELSSLFDNLLEIKIITSNDHILLKNTLNIINSYNKKTLLSSTIPIKKETQKIKI